MPNKTIYVSESDLALYDRAQESFGGNLSAAITQALRTQTNQEFRVPDDFETEFHDVTVKVGVKGCRWGQKFVGRKVARWGEGTKNDPVSQVFQLYLTEKGQFALHTRTFPSTAHGSKNKWKNFYTPGSTEFHLDVFENWEKVKDKIPDELHHVVKMKLDGQCVETLDI